MAIRDQRIDVGYGVERIRRVVYDYRSDPEWRLQTGYVQYDSNSVPVWRPYDPEDRDLDADWRTGLWRNIYTMVMPPSPGTKHVSYETEEYNTGSGQIAMLPRVEVRLTYLLREHLAKVGK
ncbi:hypothetical protein [Caulobacter soli]|uniref:hypothetical protein n=1 Tax=Caulobacter soli TaxID=2708539 RepID=UPI0013ED4841|nr:hypothetical protein [Caulobacter soli]